MKKESRNFSDMRNFIFSMSGQTEMSGQCQGSFSVALTSKKPFTPSTYINMSGHVRAKHVETLYMRACVRPSRDARTSVSK